MTKPTRESLRATMTLGDEPEKGGPRPFKMVAYTGAKVARLWGEAVFDLGGIKVPTPLPILLNHDSDKIVGHAHKATMTDDGLVLEGVVTDKTPEGRMVAALGHDGFPWTASVGLTDLQWEDVDADAEVEVNGQKLKGPLSVARAAECYETSFVSAGPADRKTAAAVLTQEATTTEGGPMTPEEFASEFPDVVKAWQEEGRAAAVAGLQALQAQFPGRTDLVLKAYTDANGCQLEAQAGLAVLLHEALTAAPAEAIEAEEPKAKRATLTRDEKVAKLAEQAGSPGLGFVAPEELADAAQTTLTPEQEWDKSEALRAEFVTLSAYKAFLKRQGA